MGLARSVAFGTAGTLVFCLVFAFAFGFVFAFGGGGSSGSIGSSSRRVVDGNACLFDNIWPLRQAEGNVPGNTTVYTCASETSATPV